MILWAGVVALLLLAVPTVAAAKFPPVGGSEAAPGVTVNGIGFASTKTAAVASAMGDARARATSIAGALGVELGGVESIDLPELTQFGVPARFCRGLKKERDGGCGPVAAAAIVTFAIVGGAPGGEGRTVSATGAASAAVKPPNRARSRSIKAAVLRVRRAIAPRAAAAAQRSAQRAAEAGGLPLGTLVSVAETPPYYYALSFYDAALGSFGPGRFCGIIRRPIVRRDPETGASKVVRRVPRRRCFVPSPYSVQMEVIYAVP